MSHYKSNGAASVSSRRGVVPFAAAVGGVLIAALTSPVQALTIQPIYSSSITSLSNAAQIEDAFNTVASLFDAEFGTPITVKIGVSWGNLNGRALPSGDIGASLIPLLGPFQYTDIAGVGGAFQGIASPADTVLTSVIANLPTVDPSHLDAYQVPYAEAQAFGYLAVNIRLDSGFIGFKSGTKFDFNPADGITAGYYDFQGLAAHEIAEVLGRYSGLPSSGSATYATPYDLLRYTAAGVNSFSSSAHAYFSVDGGKTNLGNFNYSGGGDRGDWLTGAPDSFNAYFGTGVAEPLSGNDLMVLDALGYGSWNPTQPGGGFPTTTFGQGSGFTSVPEPAAWAMMLVGFGLVGGGARRVRIAATA